MAIAFVQAVSVSGNFVTSVTTAGISTTSGNLLVANRASYTQNNNTVTDSQTLAWTNSIALMDVPGPSEGMLAQDYSENITGNASHTFSLSVAAADYPTLGVVEISGAALTGALDKTASAIDGSATTSHTSTATASTTQDNEIAVGAGCSGTNETYTIGGSYTQRINISTTATTTGLIVGTLVLSAVGAQTFTYTSSVSSRAANLVATFKEASGNAGPRRTRTGVGR